MNHYNVAFISLGCDKNRINCEQMMYLTQAAGHLLLPTPEGADVCVINTCGFIDAAKEEAIGQILQVAQLKEAGQVKKISSLRLSCPALSGGDQGIPARSGRHFGHGQLHRHRPGH